MQNKNNLLKTAYSTPVSRYYRSVKYKVTQSTAFEPSSSTAFGFNSVKREQALTSRITWKRPTSFSLHKNINNKQDAIRENVQDAQLGDLKVTYMQTWSSLMKPIQMSKKDEEVNRIQRVSLPSIIDFQPSNFTSLDPLFLPIQNIEQGILDLKKDLPLPKIQMSQIHSDMVNFKSKIMSQLEQMQSYGREQFDRLTKMIRKDQVINQQNNMRFKRSLQHLVREDEAFRSNFQGTKPRLDVLQEEIFSCRPFDLRRNAQLDQQFPQEYF